MLKKNDKKYEVLVTDTSDNKEDLICNLAEMLQFVYSGLKVAVFDYDTGEVVFDSDYPEYSVFEGTKLVKCLNRKTFLETLAEELGIIDEIDHEVTEEDIIFEIRMLKSRLNEERRSKLVSLKTPDYRISVDEVGFSKRTLHVLIKYAGLTYMDQLCNKTEKDLMHVRNLGSRTRREIKEKMHLNGYALKNEDLSFEDSVKICAARHANHDLRCNDCPLQINSVDCFYNECMACKKAVDAIVNDTADKEHL